MPSPNDETLPPSRPFPSSTTGSEASVGALPQAIDPGEETLTCIGPYEVVGKLGSGGMGVVYKCRDTSLQRFVAIKVLRKKFSGDASYQRRFRREAQTIASLSHAAVAHVYGIGEVTTETGSLLYIVMEHVDGPSVEKLLANAKKLPVEQALAIVRDTAMGLKAAHARGIVHRDIKPSNLLVTTDGTLKIVDFGLAKELSSANSLTDDGVVMGTPHYISPEQGRGRGVDHRSDVYSLGSTFYHLVTGRPPFEAASQVSVIVSHVNDQPLSPSAVEKSVPEACSRLILKMMAKSPEARHQTYEDLLVDLEALRRGGDPIDDALPTLAPPTRSPVRQRGRRIALLTASVLVVCLGLALLYSLIPPPPINAAQRAAYGPWLKLRDDGGAVLDMDFAMPPAEIPGGESWRSLLPLAREPRATSTFPEVRAGALRWESHEQPFTCGLRFERIDELQVEVGSSSMFDLGLAVIDPNNRGRQQFLLRLRPSEETPEPLVALRGGENALAPGTGLAPIPSLLGLGPFTILIELREHPAGTNITVRIERRKNASHVYESSCVLPGAGWRTGVLVLQTQSPVKPFSAALDRILIAGHLARPAALEELTWLN